MPDNLGDVSAIKESYPAFCVSGCTAALLMAVSACVCMCACVYTQCPILAQQMLAICLKANQNLYRQDLYFTLKIRQSLSGPKFQMMNDSFQYYTHMCLYIIKTDSVEEFSFLNCGLQNQTHLNLNPDSVIFSLSFWQISSALWASISPSGGNKSLTKLL